MFCAGVVGGAGCVGSTPMAFRLMFKFPFLLSGELAGARIAA